MDATTTTSIAFYLGFQWFSIHLKLLTVEKGDIFSSLALSHQHPNRLRFKRRQPLTFSIQLLFLHTLSGKFRTKKSEDSYCQVLKNIYPVGIKIAKIAEY